MLEEERSFYEEKHREWLQHYAGKFALVKGRELVGVFDTSEAALAEGARRFGLTPFLVRPVLAVQEEIHIPALTLGLLRADLTHTSRGPSSDS